MELFGKIIEVLPLQTGEGRNGPWKKQDFIIETSGQYPKKVCISMWGDKIDNATIQQGNEIKASINIESREFNGKWYTDVKAWKIETESQTQPSSPQQGFPPPPPPEEDDNLNTPFPPDEAPLPF
ncbi:MAG: DUF3127 domain-containing protein [Bacteroidales bacterium]